MIHNLYVIDAGVCLYSYDFKKNISLDEQLLSAFLSAIGSFAQETFQSGLQTIKILDGQKLIFYLEKTQKLTFCAIANEKDNDHLLENILADIAQKFVVIMADTLNSVNRPAIDEYKRFDSILKENVKNKSKDRNKKTVFLGFLTGFIITVFSTYFISLINLSFREQYPEQVFLLYFLFMLTLSIVLDSGVAGFVAGNPKYGVITGIIFFIIISVVIALGDIALFFNFLYIAPFTVIICGASGYFGGLLQDRRKLYPLIE